MENVALTKTYDIGHINFQTIPKRKVIYHIH